MQKHRRTARLALIMLAIAAAALAALAATGGTGQAAAAMTPGAAYQKVGQPLANGSGAVHFNCQLTSPAGCYGPDQIRAAYGVQPLLDRGLDGSGKTIVIIDAYGSPTIQSDLAAFDALWGLPNPSLQVIAPFGVDPTTPANASGWAGETSLDVEWAHAIAPGAAIKLVVAKSNDDSDILDATQWVRDNNAGDVVSQSYGEAEQCMNSDLLARQHQLFADMSREGMTLFASAGDQGSAQYTCDGNAFFKAVSTPASDPYVTSVGGTALHADGTTGAYQSESTWNETTLLGAPWAGGGGVSTIYTRPVYQALAERSQMRTVPDVSYNAAIYNGVLGVMDGGWYRFGGTSAGSPQWAGLAAIADQAVHGRLGPINKELYLIGKLPVRNGFFRDIADGSTNAIPDLTPYQGEPLGTPIDGYTATRGYDLATGLGTPNAAALLPFLALHPVNWGEGNGSVAGSGGSNGRHGHKHTN